MELLELYYDVTYKHIKVDDVFEADYFRVLWLRGHCSLLFDIKSINLHVTTNVFFQ